MTAGGAGRRIRVRPHGRRRQEDSGEAARAAVGRRIRVWIHGTVRRRMII